MLFICIKIEIWTISRGFQILLSKDTAISDSIKINFQRTSTHLTSLTQL